MNLTCEYCDSVFYDKKIDKCPNCGAPLKIFSKKESTSRNERIIEIKPSSGENKIIIPEMTEGQTVMVPKYRKEENASSRYTKFQKVQAFLIITAIILKLVPLIYFV